MVLHYRPSFLYIAQLNTSTCWLGLASLSFSCVLVLVCLLEYTVGVYIFIIVNNACDNNLSLAVSFFTLFPLINYYILCYFAVNMLSYLTATVYQK